MNSEPYLRRIRKEFPSLKFKNVQIPFQGMDHVALILDERWVFRFPLKKKYKDLFPHEIVLLEKLYRKLPIPIPHYTHIARDRSFGGYGMITGDSLQAKTYAQCSVKSQKRMQQQMAEFLSELHTLPIPFAKKHRVPTLEKKKEYSRRLREHRVYLQQTLKKGERLKANALFKQAKAHLDDPYKECFVHCDLYVDHIFIDTKHTKIVGVIDFGDRAIYDPSIDFAVLWEYGREFVNNVYARYTGPKDEQFIERSYLRFKLGILSWLGTARHRKWSNEKEAYDHFKKYFQ